MTQQYSTTKDGLKTKEGELRAIWHVVAHIGFHRVLEGSLGARLSESCLDTILMVVSVCIVDFVFCRVSYFDSVL